MSNKTEILSFDELARFHGLSLMKWDEDNYASENTKLAKDFFGAGQQSKQVEIDHLQKRIDKAIYDLQHIESVMWEEQVEHVLMVLKGEVN